MQSRAHPVINKLLNTGGQGATINSNVQCMKDQILPNKRNVILKTLPAIVWNSNFGVMAYDMLCWGVIMYLNSTVCNHLKLTMYKGLLYTATLIIHNAF